MRATKVSQGIPLVPALVLSTLVGALFPGELTVAIAAAGNHVVEPIGVAGVEGEIDWTDLVLTVRAKGKPKKGITHPGQKELTAREAAIAVGYADLVRALKSVHITVEVTVKDYDRASSKAGKRIDEDPDQVNAILKDTDDWDAQQEIYTIALTLPLAGPPASLTETLRQRVEDLLKPLDKKKASPKPLLKPTPPPTPLPQPSQNPCTGLIIDCRGLGMQGVLCPKVLRSDGSGIWNALEVLRRGVVAYEPTLEAALQNARAGNNPLAIRAVGTQGSCPGNAVVADEDARQILEANQKSASPRFLETCRVILVVDSRT